MNNQKLETGAHLLWSQNNLDTEQPIPIGRLRQGSYSPDMSAKTDSKLLSELPIGQNQIIAHPHLVMEREDTM